LISAQLSLFAVTVLLHSGPANCNEHWPLSLISCCGRRTTDIGHGATGPAANCANDRESKSDHQQRTRTTDNWQLTSAIMRDWPQT